MEKVGNVDKLRLKRNHEYYYQVQGQLNITKMEKCYFIVHAEKWLEHEEIMRDENFWYQEMVPKLERWMFLSFDTSNPLKFSSFLV